MNSSPVSSAVHCLNRGQALLQMWWWLILANVVSSGGIALGSISVKVFSAIKTSFFTGGNWSTIGLAVS